MTESGRRGVVSERSVDAGPNGPADASHGKAIVICSDGTGNSLGRSRETNVGRLYKAVDLSANQIKFYIDGVGTQQNKYLRSVSAAFGLGLRTDVEQAYEFLCRNYEIGDRIYLFGFSRGAYAIRLLAGMVGKCGIIDTTKDDARPGEELRQIVKEAGRAFRASWRKTGPGTKADEFLEKRSVRISGPGKTPEIEFVGVWDTVDAVGLPVDEMTVVLNKFLRFRFSDRKLGSNVKKACHAVAIDDERHTFHPELWDETDGNEVTDNGPRIEQVWFAGMHSNVGGGYPKDDLSYVSLMWMMAKAEASGLKLQGEIKDDYGRVADINGKLYDSRRGVSLIWRYKQRNIARLCKDSDIDRPDIHASVLRRIRGAEVLYGPTNIPADFRIVGEVGDDKDDSWLGRLLYEPVRDAFDGLAALSSWRRVLHASFLVVVGVLATLPLWASPPTDAVLGCSGYGCWLEWTLAGFRLVTPGFGEPWVRALMANPHWHAAIVGALLLIFVLHLWLKHLMEKGGRRTWYYVFGDDTATLPGPSLLRRIPGAIARTGAWRALVRCWNGFVLPVGTAVIAVGLVIWLVSFVSGAPGVYERAVDRACARSGASDLRDVGPAGGEFAFETSTPCYSSGLFIEKDRRYVLTIEDRLVGDERWVDRTIEASPPQGFDSSAGPAVMHLFIPFRRHGEWPWFQLVARIGSNAPFRVTELTSDLPAGQDGELFLYLNDAIWIGSGHPWTFYENNKGLVKGTLRVDPNG